MSSEKSLKHWNDTSDAVSNGGKRITGRPVWHRRILERYINSELSIHLHGQFRSIGDNNFIPICLSTSQHQGEFDGRLVIAESLAQIDSQLSGFNAHNGKSENVVLVSVHEAIEPEQRLIPSIVRLDRLNGFDGGCGNLTPSQFGHVFGVLGGNIDNRKTCGHLVAPRFGIKKRVEVSDSQFPSDIIEGSPSIREEITDYEAQMLGRRRRFNDDSCSIRILIGEAMVEIVLNEAGILRFQALEMLLSPDDFGPSAI